MSASSSKLSDQKLRDRFLKETDRNFSVIAPAGVGKTEAIVRRVIGMAAEPLPIARQKLSTLVVVTYTNRAAHEMQHRARNGMLESNADPELLASFNQAFFGTIHQFCFKLLRTYGHHLGLPSALEVLADEEALWLEFIRGLSDLPAGVADDTVEQCLRHLSATDLLAVGRRLPPGISVPQVLRPYPNLSFADLLSHRPENKRSEKTVAEGQALVRHWLEALDSGLAPLPIPKYSKGDARFKECWNGAFAPLRRWLGESCAIVGARIADAFQAYRLSKGQLTYDDQIALAAQLVDDPVIGRQLREEAYRIILDEGQDTDPMQFKVLLGLARPPEAQGDWLESGKYPPRPGHFSMVGDLQQSIYGKRANLAVYAKIHEKLAESPGGEALTFSVTFRCDQEIIDRVNDLAPAMLDGTEGQVKYVPLRPRPKVGSGQVIRLPLQRPDSFPEKPSINAVAAEEARQLASWIKQQGLEKLRAPQWSEVAILCPRKRWFDPLALALRRQGLPFQNQSTRNIQGDSPAYAWFTALMVTLAEPNNHFEIVGVLREVFGLSDQQLAEYCGGNGRLFQIESELAESDPVGEVLAILARTRQAALSLPLRDGVERMVKDTALRRRLGQLSEHTPELLQEELDGLLLRAAEAEANGLSLPQWAEELRRGFLEPREEEPVQPECIQLITCQKAKGLQWHTVILSGFHRFIHTSWGLYPRVLYRNPSSPPVVAFDSSEIPADLDEQIKKSQRQENQRLLYVAMTRAKRTLILPDGSELYKESDDCFASLLGLSEPASEAIWSGLPCEPTWEEEAPEKAEAAEPLTREEIEPVSPALVERALSHAGRFPRRVLPSYLAHTQTLEEPEARERTFGPEEETPEPSDREEALDYGTWWHKLMEKLDWGKDVPNWDEHFERECSRCSQPERARTEWARFKDSDTAKQLSGKPLIIHSEMPLLLLQEDGSCLEGVVDLAVLDPQAKRWLVLDWKTDRVETEEAGALLDRYRPQIQAYTQALTQITGLPARGAIYSTHTGLCLEVH